MIGNGLAIPLGIAVALNRHVSELLRPVLIFFQSIAGIAWIPTRHRLVRDRHGLSRVR